MIPPRAGGGSVDRLLSTVQPGAGPVEEGRTARKRRAILSRGHRGVPPARLRRRQHGRGRGPRRGLQADRLQAVRGQAAPVRRDHPRHHRPAGRGPRRHLRGHPRRGHRRAAGPPRPRSTLPRQPHPARGAAAATPRHRRGRPVPRPLRGLVRARLRAGADRAAGRGDDAAGRPRAAARARRPDAGRLPVRRAGHVQADEPGHVRRHRGATGPPKSSTTSPTRRRTCSSPRTAPP